MTEAPAHRCSESCVCPIHQTQLLWSASAELHACSDRDCEFAHGLDLVAYRNQQMQEDRAQQRADEQIELPLHRIVVHGSGHFSRAECTGCVWAFKGHADECRRMWSKYHQEDNVLPLPARMELPESAPTEYGQWLEKRIAQLLTSYVDFSRQEHLYVALGHAEARAQLLHEPVLKSSQAYVSTLCSIIAHISKRQREKLRHPSRSRKEIQAILNGEAL